MLFPSWNFPVGKTSQLLIYKALGRSFSVIEFRNTGAGSNMILLRDDLTGFQVVGRLFSPNDTQENGCSPSSYISAYPLIGTSGPMITACGGASPSNVKII